MRHLFLLFFLSVFYASGQTPPKNIKLPPPEVINALYNFESVPNDPLKTRIYTLENGLKIYLSVNKNAPRIQTYIAVRAGSKNDPADATGLAHYLEHMLFKGTDKYGSLDFAKEEPYIRKIEELYEKYRATKDEKVRKKLYREIDSISGVAAKYAIANEYDKLMSSIGAKGTNAYTWVEQTVYVNDIPANQLERWLSIEAERFRKPVMRIFHTELEAVYEEKNISLDNDQDKLWDALFGNLFRKHTYGTQTTIGTIDHLKNPSIKKIREYYDAHYIPNNMAICLSGDLDPEKTVGMINERFGKLVKKNVPAFIPPVEDPILKPIEINVSGPNPETMVLGFRLGGQNTRDAEMAELIANLLFNGKAGLVDLDLVQAQKVLGANAFSIIFHDYSTLCLNADPKEGQKLEEVKTLLLQEIEKLKKGDFPDWLIQAVVDNMAYTEMIQLESNNSRASEFVDAFIKHRKWEDVVNHTSKISKITKQEVMDFAKKNLNENYVCVYKRTGEDKNAQKVEKPAITPVEVNRNSQSEFVKNVLSGITAPVEPVFLDYETDIKRYYFKNKVPVYYNENKANKTFSMSYFINIGKKQDKKIPLAVDYLDYLGTAKYTPEQLKQEFYKLACTYGVFSSEDYLYVNLSGLSANMDAALSLFEELLTEPKANEDALKNLVSDILKTRTDAKLSQDDILWGGMYNYAMYGKVSPFTHILTEAELKAVKPADLLAIIKQFCSYEHEILYFGSSPGEKLLASLEKFHKLPEKMLPIPQGLSFQRTETNTTNVYVVDFDMKQAEILMLSKSGLYDKELIPQVRMFNEYFGSGMSSVVFQDMRESKALAYSVFSTFVTPDMKEKPFMVQSYIGTQADKLPEAMKGMFELLNKLPESEIMFKAAKDALQQNIRTQRITKSDLLFNYINAKKLGLTADIRKDVFAKTANYTLADIKAFHEKYIANKRYNIMILGKKDNLDIKTLEKYGPVKFLTLEEIFGY